MPSLRDLRSLRATERRLLFAAVVGLSVARVLLPVVGLDRARHVTRTLLRLVPPFLTVPAPDRPPWAVAVVDGIVPGSRSCLVRAIACESLLAASGYPARIHLGVAKDDGFSAHAWVEYDGDVVIGGLDGLDGFTHLESREYSS